MYRVGQKKYDCLIYYDLKSKRAITLKQVTVSSTMFDLNFDICLVRTFSCNID